MGTGIMICGLNGTGKSTLGKALAEKLHFYFIDNENLYFSGTELSCVYAAPRTREEAETLLFREMNAHENFVFASVKGDYGEAVCPFFQYAVLISVPKDIRLQRVKIVLFRNSAAECCQAEIYMGRRNGFLILLNPDQRIRLKNGCRA